MIREIRIGPCENIFGPREIRIGPCEIRIGPCEIRFDHCENRIIANQTIIDHNHSIIIVYIIETISCILLLSKMQLYFTLSYSWVTCV